MKKKSARKPVKKAGKVPTATVAKPQAKKPSMALAVAALIINAFLLPGLGTILGGKTKHGILQLIMVIGGFILGVFASIIAIAVLAASPLFGLFLMVLAMTGAAATLAGWGWAIISGAILVREASV